MTQRQEPAFGGVAAFGHSGHCDAGFAPVAQAFAQNFRDRGEVGAAVALVADGG